MVNINNIACIEDKTTSILVTLNVKDKVGNFISFTANLTYGLATGQIQGMDQNRS